MHNGIQGNDFPKHYEIQNGREVRQALTYLAAIHKATKPGDQIYGVYNNGDRQYIGTVNAVGSMEVAATAKW